MDNIDPITQNYIDILEKTNQQLSLWFNPYAIMIGVLAILFTILTIVAVVIIYRQSREYKDKIEADRKLYKEQISEFLESQKSYIEIQKKIIEENNRAVEKISIKIDDILKQYKNKLKESSAKQKEEIQKVIDKLELEKLTLKKDIGPITVSPNFGHGGYGGSIADSVIFGTNNLHKCSSCGFGFYVKRDMGTLAYVMGSGTVTCPKCNNVDSI